MVLEQHISNLRSHFNQIATDFSNPRGLAGSA